MGITAGKPCTVLTYLMTETLGSQSQQTGNNTVIISNTLSVLNTGFLGTKYPNYVGRLILINIAGTVQRRMCISESAGTGTTRILTVHRDWGANPVSSDTIHVPYDMDDLETGGANTGIALNARSGLYEWTGILNIGNGTDLAGLYMGAGEAADTYDGGSTQGFLVKNNARFDMGYLREVGSTPLSGGICVHTQNTDGEPSIQFLSGAKGEIVDSLLWSQVKTLFYENASGSSVIYRNTKFLNNSYGSVFFGSFLYDCVISGRSGANELIRIDANTVIDGLVLTQTAGLTTANGSTTTETLTTKDIVFVNNLALLVINSNKTWYVINPIWSATTYSDFSWLTSTSNGVYDQRSVDVIVKDSGGSIIINTVVVVYENTILADLVLETYTNSNGIANGVFTYKKHLTNSATTTYGGHAIRIDCWGYTPFISTLVSNEAFDNVIVLNLDSNIVASSQATALSDGSGIVWYKDTNTSCIIDYTGGTGSLQIGMVITGETSGADGVVTEIVDGDSVAGTVHLSTRDSNNFSNGESISRTGGTAGTWSASYTDSTQQNFSMWVDGNNKTMQVIYDYLAALTSQTSLSASGEIIHEWGRASQVRALYLGTSGFYTERSNSKGVFITNFSSGNVDFFTDDSGNTWSPYVGVSLTISANVTLVGAEIRIYDYESAPPDFGTELDGIETHDSSTFVYNGQADNLIYIQVMKEGYVEFGQQYTMPTSNGDFYANLIVDTNM